MLRVLHIVRRFGPVGGMERYVWRLTHELADLGVKVEVLCESLEAPCDHRIQVHRVSVSSERRRWKAMRDFRVCCAQFWEAYPDKVNLIVHSHERSVFHRVTTFHGPPIGEYFTNAPWWKRFQPRVKAWAQFEKEEVCGSQVKTVIPVSSKIGNSLKVIYPDVGRTITMPGWPGTDAPNQKQVMSNGSKLLFVGQEWKRKGLDIAIDAYLGVKKVDPFVTLDIYGVSTSDVPRHLKVQDQGVTFHGWQREVPFGLYDLLIHPARNEPFGMVVPEARASGLSVVMSNEVGARDLAFSGVKIVDITSPSALWSRAIIDALSEGKFEPEVCWTWFDLAKWHVESVYAEF